MADRDAVRAEQKQTRRAYEVFACALDTDPDEAIQEAAYVAQAILTPESVE
ncbi:hypothetical protein [Fodinicola feengrottensis]|uniref:hypothetical protein n=1 Tax=Fodinicola feengrottensis TaxID=435914 RepID=UPI0013D823CD|nr:hypothetical protein [Fodinicola feengrottensis]